eukprot:GEMP01012745.1.p1 GENE.GEMP01012745.1~~GEMP01012745.1.p1  ORF type:complete len:776 (+),score=217.25 GEMP01012745.1:85-2412(+)
MTMADQVASTQIRKNGHPTWHAPPGYEKASGAAPVLRIGNSLTDDKEPFIPKDGRRVAWYVCGPTVYDMCHMGHARAYLTFDILRRLMEDYFGYEVFYQINVTDIDDKIILRARQNKLLEQYDRSDEAKVLQDVKEAIRIQMEKRRETFEELQKPVPADTLNYKRVVAEREKLVKEAQLKLAQSFEVQSKAEQAESTDAKIAIASDYLAEYLDKTLNLGETITDNAVFEAHARRFEKEYQEDMDALKIRPPDVYTRVTEYVPEVVAFIDKVISDGTAYESNGSVYFDTTKFKESHDYPKLVPSAGKATEAEMAEGEGALSNTFGDEKRNPSDFALWKSSKAGEPSWDSPWGKGRPGWHIECSVMASEVIGNTLDIHGGGSDLKFPHHANEMAQSEAFHQCQQWVNYWMHAGHLHIKGLKMSKSLKNFITIREALQLHTARQLRLMFLGQRWDKPMDYSDQTMDAAKDVERKINSFFGTTRSFLRMDWQSNMQCWGDDEKELNEKIMNVQDRVHEAFCDNFDTPTALQIILELTSECNKYISKKTDEAEVRALLLRKAATFVTKILRILGLIESEDVGFAQEGGNKEEFIAPVLDAFAGFRDEVRNEAMTLKSKVILEACDSVRDNTMVDLGIRLEDRPGEKSIWKLEDVTTLQLERQEKEFERKQAVSTKIQNKLTQKQKELEKSQKAMVTPEEYWKAQGYTQFNDTGLPTHTPEGEELSKKAAKKVDADIKAHVRVHEELQKKAASANMTVEVYIAQMENEVNAMADELRAQDM